MTVSPTRPGGGGGGGGGADGDELAPVDQRTLEPTQVRPCTPISQNEATGGCGAAATAAASRRRPREQQPAPRFQLGRAALLALLRLCRCHVCVFSPSSRLPISVLEIARPPLFVFALLG